jgi:hypothetical protein
MALVSPTAKTAMKYGGTISINRSNSRTLCAKEEIALDLEKTWTRWGQGVLRGCT